MGSIGEWNWAVAVATARIYTHNVRRIQKSWPKSKGFTPPLHEVIFCATNLSFASELLLKATIVALTSRTPSKSHKLSDLIRNIPKNDREKLLLSAGEIFNEKYKKLSTGEVWIKVSDGPMPSDKRPSSLKEVLEHYSTDYTRWRYVFSYSEGKGVPDLYCLHFSRLISLCEALDHFLQNRFPSTIGKNGIKILENGAKCSTQIYWTALSPNIEKPT